MSEIEITPVARAALRTVKAPAKQAVVLICRRCERRAHQGEDAGRRFARRLRKLAKAQLGKRAVRTVFTSCMGLCPRDALAVAVVRGGRNPVQGSSMYIAEAARPKAAARELIAALQGS